MHRRKLALVAMVGGVLGITYLRARTDDRPHTPSQGTPDAVEG